MSLFDFFFPEQAQASHLHDLARQGSFRRDVATRPELDSVLLAIREYSKRLKFDENDIGTLALVCESLIRLGEQKGLFTRQELFAMMQEVDSEDGINDGKLDVHRMSRSTQDEPASDEVPREETQ